MCIVNTSAIVEHDCMIGDFSHIAVGAVVCGMSHIGSNTLIGANSSIIQCINVGNNVKVGAGAIILKDISNCSTVYGIWK